jgi:hypothetical protein
VPLTHPAATRDAAVRLVRAGGRPVEVATALGVATSSVYAWLGTAAPELVRSSGASCWRCRPALSWDAPAYAHLLGLYLGDGCISQQASGACALRIACGDAWPGVADECAAVLAAATGNRVSRVRKQGCHMVQAYSRHWPCLFPQHGPGRKHERPVVLQPWQQLVADEHPGRLLRGLFHSDGWRGDNVAVHRKGGTVVRYRYPRYEFTNRSDDIRSICAGALDRLGIAWRPNGPWRISVSRREAVAALDEHVGPKY